MLNIQIFALTLIPLLAGVVPNEAGIPRSPLIVGVEAAGDMSDFVVGTWRCADDFFRWGVTSRETTRVKRFTGKCLMTLRKDGTMKMENLFRPSEGRWEMTDQGLLLYDGRNPKRAAQLLPVRKRDENRMWVLLPFAHGANGIGMERVTEEPPAKEDSRIYGPGRTSQGESGFLPTRSRRSDRAPRSPRPEDVGDKWFTKDKDLSGLSEDF
ncbi:MAG: hypothetical protein V1792_13510 [Pseudomonadota bacterium]